MRSIFVPNRIDTRTRTNLTSLLNDYKWQIKFVVYQPEKKQLMKYDQKNENNQYMLQCQENESRFHYLCLNPVFMENQGWFLVVKFACLGIYNSVPWIRR